MDAHGLGSVSTALSHRLRQAIGEHGGWIPFDAFMSCALYEPGLGYYSRGEQVLGHRPEDGSDFVTAPELSPLFARCLARQVSELAAAVTDRRSDGASGAGIELWEFGAGTGALAEGLLEALGDAVLSYRIVEVSAGLRQRQQVRLARFAHRVGWLHAWPERIEGIVIGNEVLDAMPVKLLVFDGQHWHERGVALGSTGDFSFADQSANIACPFAELPPLPPAYVAEWPLHAQGFVASLAERLHLGAALFIDYGFPEAELLHPQRHMGTLMCHRGHRSDGNPLQDVGEKDITAHVNFSAIALAGQDAGLDVLGYTSQGRFLLNCGLAQDLAEASPMQRSRAQMLMAEHEMGELFKVLLFGKGLPVMNPLGFVQGDRTHRL
jgi:SAM-dependent MidA family methyltransferase